MDKELAAGGKTIMLVDDDEDFRLQHRLQLESIGYNIVEAPSAEDAETLLSESTPDLAVVDLMMEEEDSGFCLCYKIKKDYPKIPVIMVTAVASETPFDFDAATEEERSWVKADLMLQKPIRFEQLQAEIEHLLSLE